MMRKIIGFWKGLFEDMAHGWSYDKHGNRIDDGANDDRPN
jgi:hypothetical protein